ncbi:MAG: hypothetical protein MJZ37_06330 [Bacilli bacterium]|nr:hypothetical protein [Bacilli bacterium]
MNITGKAKVWVSERQGSTGTFKSYSVGVSKKKEDGSYVNGYMPARFKKGVELENGTNIDIKNGFVTLEVYNNKESKEVKTPSLMIIEFETEGTPVNVEPNWDSFNVGGDDLPF